MKFSTTNQLKLIRLFQKFEFCGKLDCPDWILAQLFNSSQLDLARFELICESVQDTIRASGKFNEGLFNKLELDEEEFDIDDARACFGSIHYIMSNACLYQVSSEALSVELEQLGLPSEHCQLLAKSLSELRIGSDVESKQEKQMQVE